ncbi:MAG: bifunctional protein GlmU [Deltaproteobacteria bacterium]|jgi:bifunctional UDP-N-acetylglucosamine pyrophosphorylase/glucosamine-1-phosphate N-acetyltransferase|nr:MAG: bifunctional protein GlmU [Deltaproteobacteria bacterium]
MGLAVIVLAAGIGRRMNSRIPKVLHPIFKRPMLGYVMDTVKKLLPERTVVVVGYGAEAIKDAMGFSEGIEYVFQPKQLGTGNAVLCAKEVLRGFRGEIVILNGDSPLIDAKTIGGLVDAHRKAGACISVITAVVEEPYGYGRILRGSSGEIVGIVEEKDATLEEKNIKEINSGVYCVDSEFLWEAIEQIGSDNKQGEYYLPDIVKVASGLGKLVLGIVAEDACEVLGINNRLELARAEQIIKNRVNRELMLSGVTLIDPEVTYISPEVLIEADTIIYPNTFIYGKTRIGSGCKIGPFAWIEDSFLGNGVTVGFSCYIVQARIEDDVAIGPFAHIRPETEIMSGAKIGNFVEIKKSTIGRKSKVPHLSYIGDACVGSEVNIGAGTITCNYDGFDKHKTTIDDHAFIGSDTMLVAPVKVGKGATTGAGSTITKDVPPGALAIGRARQVIIEEWKRRPRGKKEKD